MRKTAFIATLALTLLPWAGFAQQVPGTAGINGPPPAAGPPPVAAPPRDVAPSAGSPLYPDSQTGLDKVASDGVSTKTVKAVPCSVAARETDGFTTCIGIPNEAGRRRR